MKSYTPDSTRRVSPADAIASFFVRHISYPLWMLREGHGGSLRYRNSFDGLNTTKHEELISSQRKRLIKVLKHAHDSTIYYRRIFQDVGFSPLADFDAADFQKLPLLTKKNVREYSNELISDRISRNDLFDASTSGSTGVPMRFVRDRNCLYLRKAQELFFDRWMGYEIGDRVALFVAPSHAETFGNRIKELIKNSTCDRMLRFDPREVNRDYLEEFASRYERFRPKVIKCFPNSLMTFAEYIDFNEISLPPVLSISCTGENFYESQREIFERAFGGEVFEKYGTKECGVFACECSQHDGMHIFTEGVYLELIRDDGTPIRPGEMGRVVVTDLFNYGMPLIRYEIGDMAVAAQDHTCSCGSQLPKLSRLYGRDRDIILDSDGNPKPGYLFVEVILKMNLSAQFQVVQVSRYDITVKVIKNSASDEEIVKVKEQFQRIVGDGVTIRIEYVSTIPREPSGKYSYVKSEIRKY